MAHSNFKKGDIVKVLSGKDKGKTGKVLEVSVKDQTVLVEGVNLIVRHRRPRSNREKGQKLNKPAFVRPSKLMIVCPNCGKSARLRVQVAENGEKSRVCKNCNRSV